MTSWARCSFDRFYDGIGAMLKSDVKDNIRRAAQDSHESLHDRRAEGSFCSFATWKSLPGVSA